MNIQYRQIIWYFVFNAGIELLILKHILNLLDYFFWFHVEFTDIFFESLVKWLYPLDGLLIFYFVFRINISKYLFNKNWIKETFFDKWLDILC